MDGQLIQKTFTLNSTSFDFWVIEIEDDKFWFKAHDISVFLDYKNPDDAVRNHVPDEHRKQWSSLEPPGISGVPTPPYWKPHTVMISEGGLYRLICGTKKPEAIKFEKWVFDKLLPTLRRTGQYKLKESFNLQLAIKDEQLANQDEHITRLCEKVAVMTIRNETNHVFQLYKHKFVNEYIFIRAQARRLPESIKVVNLEKYELLLNEINVPNAMNILNRLKEKLRQQKIYFTALNNKLIVDADVPEMVRGLIQESLQ